MWGALDDEVKNTPMPDAYKFKVDILCKDCHQVSAYSLRLKSRNCYCTTDAVAKMELHLGPYDRKLQHRVLGLPYVKSIAELILLVGLFVLEVSS